REGRMADHQIFAHAIDGTCKANARIRTDQHQIEKIWKPVSMLLTKFVTTKTHDGLRQIETHPGHQDTHTHRDEERRIWKKSPVVDGRDKPQQQSRDEAGHLINDR